MNFIKLLVVNGTGMRSIDKLPEGRYNILLQHIKGTDKISRAIDSGVLRLKLLSIMLF